MAKRKYLLIFMAVFLSACSVTGHLPMGQKLYTGGEIKIADKNTKKSEVHALTEQLQDLLRPKPNAKILGFRYKLDIYNKTKTNKKKGLSHYINTHLGEPPVLVSSVDLEKNSSILQNKLENEGYFEAMISGDTIGTKKTAKAVYTIHTGPAYHIRKVVFPQDKDDLDTAVTGTSAGSFLKVGDKYNLDVIKAERIRIDARLKERGFFYFSDEDLLMKIDSNIAGHLVDIYITVKRATPDEARWIYSIRNIYVFPNYSIKDTAYKLNKAIKYKWYNIIDSTKSVKPFVFQNTILLQPGETYNRTEHNKTLNRLISLGPFKYVKNEFEDVTPDSAKLDIYYFLTQYPKKSLQVELLGRQTSANYDGTQINLNFRNRNTFKGAELLQFTFFASKDFQFGSYNNGYNVFQIGVTPSLSWPRFISPFTIHSDNAFIPHTILSINYTLINRTKLYTLNSFNAQWGYQWKSGLNKQEELDLLAITYVNPQNVTQVYKDSIQTTRNPALAHVINNQFTFGPSYSYTYTNTAEDYRANTFYYQGKISLSGNLYGIISGADTLKGKVSKLLGTPFNQYIKLENEIRFFTKISSNSKLATRLMVDVGIPYGNSTILPYSQQFFIGGANSLRGFQAHAIGPGSYKPSAALTTGTYFLPDESGDIKIEGNIEYRPKLFGMVEGAIFLEAGNIWLLNSNSYLPGAAFGKNFVNQIAADAGFGLRFNFSVIILRLDLGFPFLEPDHSPITFGHNAVFNLGIGYPF